MDLYQLFEQNKRQFDRPSTILQTARDSLYIPDSVPDDKFRDRSLRIKATKQVQSPRVVVANPEPRAFGPGQVSVMDTFSYLASPAEFRSTMDTVRASNSILKSGMYYYDFQWFVIWLSMWLPFFADLFILAALVGVLVNSWTGPDGPDGPKFSNWHIMLVVWVMILLLPVLCTAYFNVKWSPVS